jgi:hypothetical protein
VGVVGLIGIFISFAGLHVLWQGRREAAYWAEEFLWTLKREFNRREQPAATSAPPAALDPAQRHRGGTLRLVGGLALLMLGPVLFLLDLAF